VSVGERVGSLWQPRSRRSGRRMKPRVAVAGAQPMTTGAGGRGAGRPAQGTTSACCQMDAAVTRRIRRTPPSASRDVGGRGRHRRPVLKTARRAFAALRCVTAGSVRRGENRPLAFLSPSVDGLVMSSRRLSTLGTGCPLCGHPAEAGYGQRQAAFEAGCGPTRLDDPRCASPRRRRDEECHGATRTVIKARGSRNASPMRCSPPPFEARLEEVKSR